MPALHYHLAKRTDSGTTFSIIFGILAVAVVIACAIWGFVIPNWRKRHPPSPSRTKWNDGSILTRRIRRRRTGSIFPSHPAIQPLLSKPSTAQILPTYDPRIESPFPSTSELGISNTTARTNSAPVPPKSISSNGLFTPVRGSRAEEDESKNKFHTVPRANEAKHFNGKAVDFGDARDFILAVPEPLALRPRDAGRPPAVARHLDRYGTPYTISPATSDKLLHPNKLLRDIQSGNARSSLCSSTTMRIDHRESDVAHSSVAKEMVDMVDEAIEEEADNRQGKAYSSSVSSKANSLVEQGDDSVVRDGDLTALHRLHSYRSLTGARPPVLTRAGTVTRPKTPVGELRQFYGGERRSVTVPALCLPQESFTSSTLPKLDHSSENGSVSTPATSPTLPPSSFKLLPASFRTKKLMQQPSPSEGGGLSSRRTSISTALASDEESEIGSLPSGNGHRERRSSRGFYQAGRRLQKPPPLNIRSSANSSSVPRHQPRRSLTDIGTSVMAPLTKTSALRSRVRSSSMYSRDTRGFSLAQTPETPEFPSPIIDIFAEHDVAGNPFKSRESVKTRINEWTQRIQNSSVPDLPRSKQVSPTTEQHLDRTFSKSNAKKDDQSIDLAVESSTRETEPTLHDATLAFDIKQAPGGAIWI